MPVRRSLGLGGSGTGLYGCSSASVWDGRSLSDRSRNGWRLISRSLISSGLIGSSHFGLRWPQCSGGPWSLSNRALVVCALYKREHAYANDHGHAGGNYDSAVGS
jgi:hypothetical protein